MKVYLSFADSDRLTAQAIAREIEQAGHEVWTGDKVFAGENWAKEAGRALESSEAMVALISPDAMKSRAVQHEIQFALVSPNYSNRLIPVMVKPTREGSYPWIIRDMQVAPVGTPKEIAQQVLARLDQKQPGPAGSSRRTKAASASRAVRARRPAPLAEKIG
jgi:hypothetical protein